VLAVAGIAEPQGGKGKAPAAGRRDFEGFGAQTRGGDARDVFLVKSDADSGTGTLRWAIDQANRSGGRIKFAKPLDIQIKDSLSLTGKNITIDGPSAGDGGVTIWGDGLPRSRGNIVVEGSDIIIQGIRVRNGGDGIQIRNKAHDIVIDRVTVTCPGDGGIDITKGAHDVTVQNCWITGAGTPGADSGGGGAMLIKYGATRVSVHHNYFQNNLRRNPTVEEKPALVDIRNNLIENSVQSHIQLRDGAQANLVNNVFIGGKDTAVTLTGEFYQTGNLAKSQKLPASTSKEFPVPKVATLAAGEVKEVVLKQAGAPLNALDRQYRDSPDYKKTRALKAKP
jgi:pectate lyase